VRPLTLTIEGVRSYRHRCTIDFTGRNLIAIVGDTGAGKSSILEAITYALYNATTWSAGETKALIADGMPTMRVELVFLAEGRRWRLIRSTSRKTSPPSLHRLECLDREDPPLLGEEAVRQQVEQLMGMNHRAFLSAVILPQGRFQALLREEPAERTRILKGIFRLGELEAARDQAAQAARSDDAQLTALRGQRQMLIEDPAAEATRLRDEASTLKGREEKLAALRGKEADAARFALESAPRLRELEEPARRLEQLRQRFGAATPARTLAGLVGWEGTLASTRDDADRRCRELEAEEKRSAEEERAARSRGEAYEDLLDVQQRVATLVRELETVEADEAASGERAQDLERERVLLDDDGAALAELDASARVSARALAQAREALEQRKLQLREASDLLRRAREARGARDDQLRREAEHAGEHSELERRLDERQASLTAAETQLSRAGEGLATARREHAAAHAAQGLGPGDTCPVCAQTLPSTFAPPPSDGLDAAQAGFDGSTAAAARSREELRRVQTDLEVAGRRLAQSEEEGRKLQARFTAKLEELRARVPEADLERCDEELLEPLEHGLRQGQAELRALEDAAARARSDHDRAQSTLGARREALDRRTRDLEADGRRLAGRRRACAQVIQALPATIPPPAELRRDLLSPLADAAARMVEQARADHERRQDIASRARVAREELHAAVERYRIEADVPRMQVGQDLLRLLDVLESAAHALGTVAADVQLSIDLEELSRQAVELEAEAERGDRALREEAARISAEAENRRRAVAEALSAAGFDTVSGLDAELNDLRGRVGGIQSRLATAEAQIGQAARLDAQIESTDERRVDHLELHRLLADGQFVRYVIERRQRTLLAVASETLATMTGDRYGFSADFQVVDRMTGRPRSAKTLSGGETFLASLALALGLVEIAGRSGARLDALFLDEGFGTLDSNALDEALAALERRAVDGRLVAVVSHVRAVAERIEAVLEVQKPTTGSIATWREGSARQALVERDLEAGLLA
jgi:exonuclease SbcC